jgi:hypothetical protein
VLCKKKYLAFDSRETEIYTIQGQRNTQDSGSVCLGLGLLFIINPSLIFYIIESSAGLRNAFTLVGYSTQSTVVSVIFKES